MHTYETKNHKTIKIVLIIVIAVSAVLSILFGYLFIGSLKKIPLINYPKYTLSTNTWTSDSIIISAEENSKIIEYSFDGGTTFQTSNTYTAIENGTYNLVVKDKNGNLSKVSPIVINRIDNDPPIISFENVTTVQLNKPFSLKSGVNVTDGNGSGIKDNYIVTPDTIDTSVEGTYTFIYTAFDKVGNYTEKERTIIVSDVQGRTYYRYRTSTTNTVQCDPYLTECKETKTALESGTCPTGFVFNEPNECCVVRYKTCKEVTWSEWSEWSQNKVLPNSTTEVETKIE